MGALWALIRIAWRNLLRGWRRTTAVLAAIAVGLTGTLLLVGWTRGTMYQMTENAIRLQLAHLSVQAEGYQQDPDVGTSLGGDVSRRVLGLIDERDGADAAPRIAGDGLLQSARSSVRAAIVGVVPDAEARVSTVPLSMVQGEFLPQTGAARGTRRLPPVVIGLAAAERLAVEVGNKIVLRVPGDAGSGAFRISGLFETSSSEFDRSAAFIPLARAQALYATGDAVTQVAIVVDEPRMAADLQAWLRSSLDVPGRDPGVEVLLWQERAPRLAALIVSMGDIAWVFYGVVFVAMVFGIANALLMAVYERTREFAVLRAIGLQARRMMVLVVLESLVLTLTGTALGLAAGFGLVLWVGELGIDLGQFSEGLRQFGIGTVIYPRLDWQDLTSPAVFASVTALLAGLWPAWKISRLRPAEALRRT